MNCCTRVAAFLPACTSSRGPECSLYRALQFPVACERRDRVIRCVVSPSRTDSGVEYSREMGVSTSRDASSRPPSRSKGDVSEGRAPAPWILHGRGYAFPFLLPQEATSAHSAYAEDPNELVRFVGGVGGFVLSDYRDSPVGPYKELVFVPGRYQYRPGDGALKKAHGVSRIWVDNEVNHAILSPSVIATPTLNPPPPE